MGMCSIRSFALSLAALATSACVATAPTGPTVSPSAGPTAPVESTTPAPGVSVQPSAPASGTPATSTQVETLQGKVYDEAEKPVPDGTRVTVRSIDAGHPFETTVETRSGTYVVNLAPVGVALEISATREGWTKRSRVEVLRLNPTQLQRRNLFNFGGPNDENDPAGLSYFISNYPEVESVEPGSEASSQPNDRMSFKLVMSEELDPENQRKLAAAFMIIPNDQEALAADEVLPPETATSTKDLVGLRAGSSPTTTSAYRYRQNSGFLNGFEVSEFKWAADNRTATFTLNAPVKTGTTEEAEYAFLLVQQEDEGIKDKQGQPFGMNDQNQFGGILRGQIIHHAVKETDVNLALGQTKDGPTRWADTHFTYTTFSVATDNVAPGLVSVLARRNYVDDTNLATDRLELTFSEPMIAYPRISGSQLLSLNNYVVTAGKSQEEVEARKLSDNGSAADIPVGSTFDVAREAIEGDTGGVISSNAASTAGNYSIAVSVKDPRIVILSLPAGSLPPAANYVKVYVGSDAKALGGSGKSVTDPAGNVVDANRRTASGLIQ